MFNIKNMRITIASFSAILSLSLWTIEVGAFPKPITFGDFNNQTLADEAMRLISLYGVKSPKIDEKHRISPEKFTDFLTKYNAEYFKPLKETLPGEKSFSFFKDIRGDEPVNDMVFQALNMHYLNIDFLHPKNLNDEYYKAIHRKELEIMTGIESNPNTDPMTVSKKALGTLLDGVLGNIRNSDNDLDMGKQYKAHTAAYLFARMGLFGHITGLHSFHPKLFTHSFKHDLKLQKGSNMMTIIPGTKFGTRQDKILLLGAHWDTVNNSPGFDDNASGVAAIMETLRALSMGHCKPEFTIIFALFDLEEYGSQGSQMFVRDFLINTIIKPLGYPDFQGAFIVDSIMNVNTSLNSQIVPDYYKKLMPEVSQEIEDEGFRGDFIGVYGRSADDALTSLFRSHWRNEKYKFKNFTIQGLGVKPPHDDTSMVYTNFLRSDHARLWYATSAYDTYFSFPAVMISDSGPARGSMIDCYHRSCDRSPFDKVDEMSGDHFEYYDFLAEVTQTLVDAVVDASNSVCPNSKRVIQRRAAFDTEGLSYFKIEPIDLTVETTTSTTTATTMSTTTTTTSSTTTEPAMDNEIPYFAQPRSQIDDDDFFEGRANDKYPDSWPWI